VGWPIAPIEAIESSPRRLNDIATPVICLTLRSLTVRNPGEPIERVGCPIEAIEAIARHSF